MAAVHFYATPTDQSELLDYLGVPTGASLHPWPLWVASAQPLSRQEALSHAQVMVVSRALGEPVGIGPGDAAMSQPTRSGVLNRLNWEALSPARNASLVDSNVSPVLLWTPATQADGVLTSGSIGSQADSMRAVSLDYERWATRVMSWVRRKGTKVWGLQAGAVRDDLDLRRNDVTTVVALPDALAALESGASGV